MEMIRKTKNNSAKTRDFLADVLADNGDLRPRKEEKVKGSKYGDLPFLRHVL